jgi:putative flippase GtrA
VTFAPVQLIAQRRDLVVKLARCATVSVVTGSITLTVLGLGVGVAGLAPVQANVLATVCGAIPSYALNRRWVWRCDGPSDLRRQLLPFWAMAFAGLLLSTLLVGAAGHWADGAGISPSLRTLVVQGANCAAWGSLWVVQFVAQDRWLFRQPSTA